MIPILYKEDETIFSSNGIGQLHEAMVCPVIEERNGSFELELEYPLNGQWASEIKDFRIISAKPNDEDEPHNFRIYNIIKDLESQTITIFAATVTNDLGGNLVQNVTITNMTAENAMNEMKANAMDPIPYNFISDIQTVKSTSWWNTNPLACLAGNINSIINIWGGEIKRTNDTIFVYGRRGTDKVTTLRPGKNIKGLSMTVSTKGLVTSIAPYVQYTKSTEGSEPVTIWGDRVDSTFINNYPVKSITPIDYSNDSEIFPEGDFSDEDFEAALLININAKAQSYFTTQYPGIDRPKVTIEVDMMQLSDSPEYEKFKVLEHVSLTDTVVVWVEKFNIDVELKVNKITYNSLSEQVTNITAGSERYSLYQDVTASQNYTETIDKLKSYVNSEVNGIYNTIRTTADSKNNIFSGYTEPDESLVKNGDIWYKPVADGEIEMYRWDNTGWVLAVGNADKLVLGSIDANVVNLVNLNASNISTGTIEGANGGWDLNSGNFWLGSASEGSSLTWDGTSLVIKMSSGNTIEEEIADMVIGAEAEYYSSTSNTALSGGSWSTTAPVWQSDRYIWTRTKITYKYQDPSYTPSSTGVCISGVDGLDGIDGESGLPGVDGTSSYTHIAWSTSSTGSTGFSTTISSGKTYIGMYVDSTEADSQTPSKYKWSLIKGADGTNGTPGLPGEDGLTPYLHIAYATSSTGSTGFSTTVSLGKTYIGTYTDFIEADSTIASMYNWALIKGADGYTPIKGTDYFDGVDGNDGEDGTNGVNGVSNYLWVRYSQNSNGNPMTTTPTDAKYIGTAVTTVNTAPISYTSYNWSLIKGTDGVKGETGSNGQTSYLHIKYSNNGGSTFTANGGETVGDWIGTYVDFISTDSTSVSAYTWNKVKGEKGDTGDRGLQGLQGDDGTQGIQGPPGVNGISNYTHIAYATGLTGQNFSTSHFTSATYIGIYVDTTATDSTNYTVYKWSLIKGTDGTNGVNGSNGLPGPKGDDGLTPYFHTAWATNATGTTGFSTTVSAGKTYLGTYTDHTEADSNTPGMYVWTLIKGEQGIQGIQGPTGATGTGISSVTEKYLASSLATGVTSGTAGWTDAMQTMTTTNKYLWNYELINFSDGRSEPTVPVIIGVYGNTGNTGGTGATGRALTSVTEYYLASASSSGVLRTTSGWTTTMQQTTITKPYLWNYEKLAWSVAPLETFIEPVIIGVHGATGAQGPIGNTGAQGPIGNTGVQGPIGPQGDPGNQGIQGPTGANGLTSYTHLAYATGATGQGFSTTHFANATYIGMYIDFTASDSTNYTAYKWSLIKGADGAQGIAGSTGPSGLTPYLHIAWSTSSTGSTGFSTTVSANKTYLGTYTDYLSADSNDPTKYKWSLIKGADGVAGRSITSVDVWYYLSTSATAISGGTWVTTAPTWVNGRYMWSKTITTYSSGSPTESTPACITGAQGTTGNTGATGATGSQGPTGATGTSITGVAERYLATSASSGVTSSTTGWASTIQTMTVTNKYLWNYEIITFSDGHSEPTIPVIIGVYGNTGNTGSTGATGRALVSVTEYYLATSAGSGVTRATGGWSTAMQVTTVTNKYLWNYEVLTWSSGTITTYVEPIIIGVHGATGNTGSTGATGKGITSITEEYAISASKTVAPTVFSTTRPTWTAGNYIWTRSKIIYNNPTSTVYTTAIPSTEWEAVNVLEPRVQTVEQATTASAITNTFITEFGKADSRQITKGIVRLDQNGVNVAKSASDVNTQLASDGLTISDGTNPLAIFGETGAVIPMLDAAILRSPWVMQKRTGGTVTIGVGKDYTSIQEAITSLFKTGYQFIDNTIRMEVYGNHNGNVIFENIYGGQIDVIFMNGARLYGYIVLQDVYSEVRFYTSGSPRGLISVSDWPFTIRRCKSVKLDSLDLIGVTVALYAVASNVTIRGCDLGSNNFYYGYIAEDGSTILAINNRGRVTGPRCEVRSGMIHQYGEIHQSAALDSNSGGSIINTSLVSVASTFQVPAVTAKVFTQLFTSAIFDTLAHGTSNISPHYGASAAQNCWDTSYGWFDGRIRMGAEIFNFFNGGSSISIRMRLRRKNSTHGSSGAVYPAPYNHSANFPSGAVRGGWTGWATLPTSYFGAGGAGLTYYNGVSGINGYAIWDAIEVEVTVTKSV